MAFDIYIFGYGSLMNQQSASKTLNRTVEISDFFTARLYGYSRSWSLEEKVFSDYLNREVSAIFLNIEQAENAFVNGTLLRVSPAEMERLKIREKNYDCAEVTASIQTPLLVQAENSFKVFTFIAKSKCNPPQGAYVPQRYLDMIRSACEKFGGDFLREYLETTETFHCEILEGAYRFVDPSQARAVSGVPFLIVQCDEEKAV